MLRHTIDQRAVQIEQKGYRFDILRFAHYDRPATIWIFPIRHTLTPPDAPRKSCFLRPSPRPSVFPWLLHDKNRAPCPSHHGFRHASEHKAVHAATSIGPHHDEIGLHAFRLIEDDLDGISRRHNLVADDLVGLGVSEITFWSRCSASCGLPAVESAQDGGLMD